MTSGDPFVIAQRGILLARTGDRAGAADIFLDLIRDHPNVPFGWQELGLLYALEGRSQKALYLLRRGVRAAPDDFLPRRHCAVHLHDLGRHIEADQVLAAHRQASTQERARIVALRQFLRFYRLWPEHRALALANTCEQGGRFFETERVERDVMAAVEDQRPFALVRLGDGEGAWLALDDDDEAQFHELYAEHRRDFVELWFGDENLLDAGSFRRVASDLFDGVPDADVVGVPYSLRIANEYRIRSTRGVPCNVKLLRWVAETANDRSAYCSHDVHLALHDSGFFKRLFGLGRPVALITCHVGLRHRLSDRAGASVMHQLLVPEEKGFSDIVGGNGLTEAHFPFHFERTMQAIRATAVPGMIWLVAAGFLGKLYCLEIRKRGGIALDVGSVVDGWMGKVTRPTLEHIERFAL